ncbi:hypothetical protein FJT64_023294 [Amphibalanus amphitrite]|uniref:Uncharacterized protein n=1 Tax=Amphibalanus amphitrite TaxID=1232801 RepID=A0A6A4WS90_AMPAM|nr:hypothetical protein FJT64_023294 [Amphibalanus amphitrite]
MPGCRTELRLEVQSPACVSALFVSFHKTVCLGGALERSPPPLPSPLPPPLPPRTLVPAGTVQERLERLSRRAAVVPECPLSRAGPTRRSLTYADCRRFWDRRSDGDLQKSEAAQNVEEKVVWQPLTTSELEMTSPLPPDAADWPPLTTSEMTSSLPPDAANWPPLTITEEWPVTSLAGGPRGPRWAPLAVADRDLLPGDLGDLGLFGDLGDLGSLPRHSDDTATAVPTSAAGFPPVQKPLPVDVTADLTGDVTASVSPLSEFADAAAGPAGWDSSDTEVETAPDISLTELPAGAELDQDQCRLISVARQLADVAEGLRRLSLTEEPEQDWASPEPEVGRDPLVGEESGDTALGEGKALFQDKPGRISSQRENIIPSVREADGSVRRSAVAFGGPSSLASGPSPPGSPLGDASWGGGGLSLGPPTLSGSDESLGPHIQRTDSTEEEDQGPVCAQVRLVVRTRSPGCEAVEIRSIRQFVSGEPGRLERALRAGSAAARNPPAGPFESQRCVTRAEVAARSAEAQRPDDLGLMATLQGEGRAGAAGAAGGGSPGLRGAAAAGPAAPEPSQALRTPSPPAERPAEDAAGRQSVSSWASSPPELLDDYPRPSSSRSPSVTSRSPSVTSSASDVMERVLQPDVIAGTPEAESYFRDQSRRMFKHALRGDLDIDVEDLDTLAPGSGLYVIEGDDEGDDSEAPPLRGARRASSACTTRWSWPPYRAPAPSRRSSWRGRIGDRFDTRTLPRASSFEDVYRRALDEDEEPTSEHSDESDATYPSVNSGVHGDVHHVAALTVTDADDVRDVTDGGEEGVVTEPDEESSDSDPGGGRPIIVELADDDDATGNP